MAWLILIDALVVAIGFVIWYWCLNSYNRKRGEHALEMVESGCGGRCSIASKKWPASNVLLANLTFPSNWFENARLKVHLRPRHLPLQWLHSIYKNHDELITFEADLDCSPNFRLQMVQHQWMTHGNARQLRDREWSIHRPGPIVLTTQSERIDEFNSVVNALLTSRKGRLLSLRFRPESPHLVASLPLQALSDESSVSSFFKLLRALAAGASTHRQL